MSDISALLGGVEGLAPEAIAAIEALVKSKEAELVASLETKYGVKPSVVGDVKGALTDVIADAPPAPADATPTSPAVPVTQDTTLQDLIGRLNSLEQQNAQLLNQIQNPEQVIASGGGDPVPHTLFLASGDVVKNHGGIATHYTTTNADGTENVQKVVAAYPS
jgi:hypothetical protein